MRRSRWTVLLLMYNCFCFFKQKTAYEMRISDWSSDVCSSDLDAQQLGVAKPADLGMVTPGLNAKYASGFENPVFTMRGVGLNDVSAINNPKIGRASCRESVCQSV